jgi:hypothetical protein
MSSANQTLERDFKNFITKFENIDIDKNILRTGELGPINFTDIESEVKIVFSLLRKLLDYNLVTLPREHLEVLQNKTHSIYDNIDRMQTFSVRGNSNPNQDNQNIILNFNQAYNEWIPIVMRAIQFLSLTQNALSPDNLDEEIRKKLLQIGKAEESFKQLVERHSGTINQIAQDFGMRNYAKIFRDESDEFKNDSKTWFTAAILTLMASGGLGLSILFIPKDFISTFDVIQFTITKFVVLTAAFYGATVCFKNYKASKHNQILNKHRHNALMTFEAFTGSKEDSQTKAAVLLAATQTIFGNQSTGYNVDSVESDLPSKIVEIIKTPTS